MTPSPILSTHGNSHMIFFPSCQPMVRPQCPECHALPPPSLPHILPWPMARHSSPADLFGPFALWPTQRPKVWLTFGFVGGRLTGAFYVGNGWVAGGCWDDYY